MSPLSDDDLNLLKTWLSRKTQSVTNCWQDDGMPEFYCKLAIKDLDRVNNIAYQLTQENTDLKNDKILITEVLTLFIDGMSAIYTLDSINTDCSSDVLSSCALSVFNESVELVKTEKEEAKAEIEKHATLAYKHYKDKEENPTQAGHSEKANKHLSTLLASSNLKLILLTIVLLTAIICNFKASFYLVLFIIVVYIAILCFSHFFGAHKLRKELNEIKKSIKDLKDPKRAYERLGIDVIKFECGNNLLEIIDPERGGQILAKVAKLRQDLADSLGYIIPEIRFLDNINLDDNAYELFIHDTVVAKGYTYPGRIALTTKLFYENNIKIPETAIRHIHQAGQEELCWITTSEVPDELIEHIQHNDSYIISDIQESVLVHVDRILSSEHILKIIEIVKKSSPHLISSLIPEKLTPFAIKRIFVYLVQESVSIKNILYIFEQLNELVEETRNPEQLGELLRLKLRQEICAKLSRNEKQMLFCIHLSQEWQVLLKDTFSKKQTLHKLNTERKQYMVKNIRTTFKELLNDTSATPVLMAPSEIRRPIFELLKDDIPQLVVLSEDELLHHLSHKELTILHPPL